MIDPIPVWTAWARKMVTFKAISSPELRRPLSQRQFVARMSEMQQRALRSNRTIDKTIALWRMENLSAAFLRNGGPGRSLNDPALAEEVRAIAHCGIGIGAVEVSAFRAPKLLELIDSFSNPLYRLFAFDNVGAMLGVYEPGIFHTFARFFTLLGFLPAAPLRRPEPAVYLKAFDAESRRLIAHGYGRMLYFSSHDIVGAVKAALSSRCFEAGPCVQGIAFAYSMVNSSELDAVFRGGQALQREAFGRNFSEGLVFALEFWEWVSPGFLEHLISRTKYGNSVIDAARKGVDAGRASGALAPFRVAVSASASN